MTSRTAGELIVSSPMFAGLPAREVAALAAAARADRVAAREYVFMEGDPSHAFCFVMSGRVKILRQSRTGKDVVLELLGPGEPFGGVAVFERRPYPASAQAMEPSVIVKIPQDAIASVAERHPALVREMAMMISRRLRAAHDSVKSLAADPAEARLAAALLRLAEQEGARDRRGLVLGFHVTRQTLADMTGTTVETAIRVISRWIKDDVVADDAGRLVLVDVDALRSRVP
jgi:CRP/FNR family transcriptional regulator